MTGCRTDEDLVMECVALVTRLNQLLDERLGTTAETGQGLVTLGGTGQPGLDRFTSYRCKTRGLLLTR